MKLALPPANYIQRAEIERNRALEQADRQTLKKRQDIEMGSARVILTAPDGGRWALEVDNSGTVSASSV